MFTISCIGGNFSIMGVFSVLIGSCILWVCSCDFILVSLASVELNISIVSPQYGQNLALSAYKRENINFSKNIKNNMGKIRAF